MPPVIAAALEALPRDEPVAVVRDRAATILAVEPVEVVRARGKDALAALDRLTPGWWAGFLAYDLGRAIEPVRPRLPDPLGLPDVLLVRFASQARVHDTTMQLSGNERGARARLRRLLSGTAALGPGLEPDPVELGRPHSSLDRDAFEAGVRAIVGLLEAGECYQVNLTRQLSWPLAADAIALYRRLMRHSPAPHGALLRLPLTDADTGAVVSASPERFLHWEQRTVETRPIKGTATDVDVLRASAKDRAENVMIVDLARNDLGRVCDAGSVTVDELCGAEPHPGLWHLVSTVRGRRRADVGLGALLRATMPPASVTGAPKPRVLQAIEDLEPVRRGVYCGALGWLDTEHDRGDLAVAIRTFTVLDGATFLGVGAGIVADSIPSAEWDETELKAARLLRAAGALAPALVRA